MKPHPQRLTPPAAPGALFKRAADPTRVRIRAVTDHDPAYLDQVRQCACLHCGLDPAGEAAHVRMASGAHGKASGIGKKPADRWALPLCGEHHRIAIDCQHKRSEHWFWSHLDIDPFLTCETLYAQRGDLVAMRAVVMTAIAQRGLEQP